MLALFASHIFLFPSSRTRSPSKTSNSIKVERKGFKLVQSTDVREEEGCRTYQEIKKTGLNYVKLLTTLFFSRPYTMIIIHGSRVNLH